MKRFFIRSFFLFLIAAFLGMPRAGEAATLYFFPASAVKSAGSNFTVSVYANSSDQPLNAVSGVIDFPADKLEVTAISKSNSIVNFWIQEPSFSNQDGKIRFEGVALNPGYTGATGRVIAITFRPKVSGTAALKFSSGAVLANDGQGTNILTSLGGGNYTIQPDEQAGFPATKEVKEAAAASGQLPGAPLIKSETHPLEESWYNVKNLRLSWDIPPGVDGVSYALDTNAGLQLVPQGKGLISNVAYDITRFTDGVWYFHLRFHTQAGWGPQSKRMIKIDFTPPSVPVLERRNAEDPTSPRPSYSWSATDTTSGIAKYELKIGDGAWIEVAADPEGFELPLQAPGEHQLILRAHDEAGNWSDTGTAFMVVPIDAPLVEHYSRTFISPSEPFEASGRAPANSTVELILNSGGRTVVLQARSDAEGRWNMASSEKIPGGAWELSAKSTDSRGATSLAAPVGQVEVVSPWMRAVDILSRAVSALGMILLGLGALLGLLYVTFGKSILNRMVLRREFFEFKGKVKEELDSLEKDIERMRQSGRIDPKNPDFQETERKFKSELATLVEDVRRELRRIDE